MQTIKQTIANLHIRFYLDYERHAFVNVNI